MPLKLHLPAYDDLWDESTQRFISTKEADIVLEHSLVSISKWEQKWKRAFLSNKPLTDEQILDYIERCMPITSYNNDPNVYKSLRAFPDLLKQINDYMNDPMSASHFNDSRHNVQQHYKNRVITTEEIYYIMASNNIPIEFQKWHLNRLLALLKVFEVKNTPPGKRSKNDMIRDYAAINRANKAKFHTKG